MFWSPPMIILPTWFLSLHQSFCIYCIYSYWVVVDAFYFVFPLSKSWTLIWSVFPNGRWVLLVVLFFFFFNHYWCVFTGDWNILSLWTYTNLTNVPCYNIKNKKIYKYFISSNRIYHFMLGALRINIWNNYLIDKTWVPKRTSIPNLLEFLH